MLFKSLIAYSSQLDEMLADAFFPNMTNDLTYSQYHLQQSFARNTYDFHRIGLTCLQSSFGFELKRQRSLIDGAGIGVFVTAGAIAENHIAAIYPGYWSIFIYIANTTL